MPRPSNRGSSAVCGAFGVSIQTQAVKLHKKIRSRQVKFAIEQEEHFG